MEGDRRRLRSRDEAGLHLPARDADRPRPEPHVLRDRSEEIPRRLVHPVHVVDPEERARGQDRVEELRHDLVEALTAELLVQLRGLRRRFDREIHRHPDQGQPRTELWSA